MTLFSNASHHNGIQTSAKWGKIYRMFRDEAYPKRMEEIEDEKINVEVYTNILRSHLHYIAARPTIFPYT